MDAAFENEREGIDKYLFGYPAGKVTLAAKLVPLIPSHDTYVEPFCGSAAVFFAKEPAKVEVLCDRNPEVVQALRDTAELTDADVAALERKSFTGDRATFNKLKDASPSGRVDRLHRFLYLSRFSFQKARRSFAADTQGLDAAKPMMARVRQSRERFHAGVKFEVGDYDAIARKYDGPNTFLFMDPPYVNTNAGVGEPEFDEERFAKLLASVKGKFLVTYGAHGKLDTSAFKVGRLKTHRHVGHTTGRDSHYSTLVISNYERTGKSDDFDEVEAVIELDDQEIASLAKLGATARALSSRLLLFVEHVRKFGGSGDAFVNAAHAIGEAGLLLGALGGADVESGSVLGLIDELLDACVSVPDQIAEPISKAVAAAQSARAALDDVVALDDGADLPPSEVRSVVVGERSTWGPVSKVSSVLSSLKSFSVRSPFLYLGNEHDDVNMLFRGPLGDEIRKSIEAEIGRMLPSEAADGFRLNDGSLAGPYTEQIEIADLVVQVRPTFDARTVFVKQDDPLFDLPKRVGPQRAVMQYHFQDDALHLDMRFSVGPHLIGWTVANKRAGASGVADVREARSIAKSFSVDGDRFTRPFRDVHSLVAVPKRRQSLAWLDVDSEMFSPGEAGGTRTSKGIVVTVDRPKVEFGLQKPFSHEYFVTGGKSVSGILNFRQSDPDGDWFVSVSKSMLPAVLQWQAVQTRSMPPDGRSGLPLSLEREVPQEFRYWKSTGDEARRIRDALVKSRHFTSSNVQIVNGEFRRVVQKLFLADAPAELAERVDWSDHFDWSEQIGAHLDREVVETFGAIHKCKSTQVAYFDAGVVDFVSAGELNEAVRKGLDCGSDFVIGVNDSPFARTILATAGPVFKFVPDRVMGAAALDKIFVSSCPLSRSDGIEWLDTELAPTDAWTSSQIEKSHPRDQCMTCKAEPEVECIWADGRGRAWFCARHFDSWREADEREIVRQRRVKNGIVGEHYGDDVEKVDAPDRPQGFAEVLASIELAKQEGMTIQSLILSKDKFATRDDANKWIREHEFRIKEGAPDETEQSWRYRQREPSDFVDGSFRTVTITGGVSAVMGRLRDAKGDVRKFFDREIPIMKTDEERFVLGIVLVPEEVDSQGDIYSASEIRTAAHRFMEQFQNVGLMHRDLVNEKVKILESFIAPADFGIGSQSVKKGTWIMAVRVLDDRLWGAVKDGDLTGFSIGGSAVRVPARA